MKNIFAKHRIEEFVGVVRASEVKDLMLLFFENVNMGPASLFPLENDENTQNIELQ